MEVAKPLGGRGLIQVTDGNTMKIFDNVFATLEKSMDIRFKRHAILTGNIANTDTPGYRAREVDFSGELDRALNEKAEALTKTNALHMDVSSESAAHTVLDTSGTIGADGNNVDLDIQLGKVSSNSRGYQNALSLYDMKLRLLRLAVRPRNGGL